MGTSGWKRITTAKQHASRHLLWRLREAGSDMRTDLNRAYELMYAAGVEKQGKKSRRIQMIPGEEALSCGGSTEIRATMCVCSRQSGRLEWMDCLPRIPTAPDEVAPQNCIAPARCLQPKLAVCFIRIDCVMSTTSNGPPKDGGRRVEPCLDEKSRLDPLSSGTALS
jgi:hypothetical protein